MPRLRLNLAALRENRLPAPPQQTPTLERLLANEGALTLSRRELLGLAGVAALTVPSLSKGIGSSLLGGFELLAEGHRVRFRLAGKDRWVIDSRLFAGTPRLKADQGPGWVRVRLSGAYFPGTRLPADFDCEARRGLAGWRMRLKFALGDLEAEVPLESWLAGAEPFSARGEVQATACELGGGAGLALAGSARATFLPDWTLRLAGPQIARLWLPGAEIAADTVTLSLPSAETPSLLNQPPARRILFCLERGNRRWPLGRVLAAAHGERLVADDQTFDSVTVEIGQTRLGTVRGAMVAFGPWVAATLRFRPGGGLKGSDGGDFALPLRNARYALAFDGGAPQSAVLADYPREPVWMRLDGCGLHLGGEGSRPFEAVAGSGRSRRLLCEPALLGLAAALPGVVVKTAPAPEGTRVALLAAGETAAPPPSRAPSAAAETTPPAGRVLTGPERAELALGLRPFTVSVVRPEDLLALTFRFVNLELQTKSGQTARLVRSKANQPAYVVVEFPPQHIGEEALYEADANLPTSGAYHPEGTPPDKDAGKSDTDPPKPPPVGAILAGNSRLSFRVPDQVKEIPYTLKDLLDWSKLELAVSPLALPPPMPAHFEIKREAGRIKVIPHPERPPIGSVRGPVVAPQRPGGRPAAAPGAAAQPTASVSALEVRPELVDPGLVADMMAVLKIRPPAPEETAIEAPYRLTLSPNELAGFVHSTDKVTRRGRTELWHTRLGVRASDGHLHDLGYEYAWDGTAWRVTRANPDEDTYERLRTLRAIWSPDYSETAPPHDNTPFRMSLDRHDRCELVTLMADYRIPDCRSRVTTAKRLMLTSLGAWLDTRYGAELPLGQGLSVEEWRHQATMGRDQYVRVVYKGYLFPFGHRAALIKVTERKFERVGAQTIAYLRQRMFIVVREPEKVYPAVGQPNEGRAIPFRRARITTIITPNLGKPENSAVLPAGYSAQAAFWPMVGTEPFPFHMVVEDWEGQRSEFKVPMIFVGVEGALGGKVGVAFDQASAQKVRDHYLLPANEGRRRVQMFGQKVAFADPAKPGDTTLESTSLLLGAELDEPTHDPLELEKQNQPRFYPTLIEAQVRIPALAATTGKAGDTTISLHPTWVKGAWNNNQGQVWASVAATPLAFSGDQSGGLATPNLTITGLSRTFGPIGGKPEDLLSAAPQFKPAEFFDTAALLFGAIPLGEIIEAIFGDDQVPKLITETEKDASGVPTAVTTILRWKPQVASWPEALPIFKTDSKTAFNIEVVLRADLKGGSSSAKVSAALTNFALNLIPIPEVANYFVQVGFKSISFLTETGKKTDVSADLGDIKFGGPLSFINTLSEIIPLQGFLDPPTLDVSPSGVVLGYSLALPTTSVGVFSLQNIAFSAEINLPFIGDCLSLRFAFASRQNPFLITVSMFGGGGFVGIELTPKGLRTIEASLEFGGNFAMDIGVASGGVYVMAGIYFKLQDSAVTLEGYLRCGGALEILGIITLSMEFYMGLTYQSVGNQVWGRASLTVEIEILFFSVGVTLTVERQFAGSSGGAAIDGIMLAAAEDRPPLRGPRLPLPAPVEPVTFKDLVDQNQWKVYCEAFA